MLLSLLSELTQYRAKAKAPASRLQLPAAEPRPRTVPVAQPALPIAEIIDIPPQSVPAALPAPRRLGTASHLRTLTPQEVLLCLMGQLSALMDSLDGPDWTINPAFHPDVDAFIRKHANQTQFVTKARALQRNRAPYYSKMVVPGPRRQTILSLGRGRSTVVD